MTYFVVHDTQGKISRTGACPSSMSEIQAHSAHEFVVQGMADGDTDYVVQDVITKRPSNPTTLSGTTLSSLPSPCTIKVNATEYACTDTSATLSLTYSGTYKIVVEAWPHLDAVFTIIKP